MYILVNLFASPLFYVYASGILIYFAKENRQLKLTLEIECNGRLNVFVISVIHFKANHHSFLKVYWQHWHYFFMNVAAIHVLFYDHCSGALRFCVCVCVRGGSLEEECVCACVCLCEGKGGWVEDGGKRRLTVVYVVVWATVVKQLSTAPTPPPPPPRMNVCVCCVCVRVCVYKVTLVGKGLWEHEAGFTFEQTWLFFFISLFCFSEVVFSSVYQLASFTWGQWSIILYYQRRVSCCGLCENKDTHW